MRETNITYNGWTYFTDVEDREDCQKVEHWAAHESGVWKVVHHTPYESMTQESFAMHVRMRFKQRIAPHGVFNWYHKQLSEVENEYR